MSFDQNVAYIVLVDENTQNAILDELSGFWLTNCWNTADLSTAVKIGTGYFRFKFIIPHKQINNELKYALFKLFTEGQYVPNDGNRICFSSICKFISEQAEAKSIIAKPLNSWLLRFRNFLENTRKTLSRNGSKGDSRNISSINMFKKIYIKLYDYYDPLDIFDRPEIDLNKVCSNGSKSSYAIVKMKRIKQAWLRDTIREYIKLRAATSAPGTLLGHFNQLVRFSCFLEDEYPSIEPHNVNRDLLLKYLEFILVSVKKGIFKSGFACNAISYLGTFIRISSREGILQLDKSAFYYNEDIPKRDEPKPRDIPEDVVKQMIKHLYSLKPTWRLILILLLESGARVNEILSLPLGCLTKDNDDDYWLNRFVWKQSKWHSVPISLEIGILIKEWANIVQKDFGKFTSFLFPNKSGKKHLSLKSFSVIVNRWISKNNIVDKNGKLWRFRPHDCRHTVATRMMDQNLAHHFICDFLGHDSVEMTRIYAKIKKSMVRGVTNKVHEKRRKKTGDNEIPDFMLKEISLAETVNKNTIAQSLPNGKCNIPVKMASCLSGGACLDCNDFDSSPAFLPIFKNQLKEELGALEEAKSGGYEVQINTSEHNISLLKEKIADLEGSKQ